MDDEKTAETPLSTEEDDWGRRVRSNEIARKPKKHDWLYWGPTSAIPDYKLMALMKALQHDVKNGFEQHEFQNVKRLHGAFHSAYILESEGVKVCVRIPACGWPGRWTEVDQDDLRAAALGLRFMKNNTSLPTPVLYSYDMTMDNEIGAPYTLMSFVEGGTADAIWKGTCNPRCVIENKRQNFLRSLAHMMCGLKDVRFEEFGTLWFEWADEEARNPRIGDGWRLDGSNIFMVHRKFNALPVQTSVAEMLASGKAKRFEADGYPEQIQNASKKGVYILWEMMIDAFEKSTKVPAGEPEFVLMQSDFSPQNILVNGDGVVTGSIDWDCLEAIPRQVGWSCVPHWLAVDWEWDFCWPLGSIVLDDLKPDDYVRYRNEYARYLREACGGHFDSVYTAKSHIYRHFFNSFEAYPRVRKFVFNVLIDIMPRNGFTLKDYAETIGKHGFRRGEQEWLEEQLFRFFAPGK
ncbi:hypothetical protein DOTSEDRAFT_126816 [Dothistroma septosporum NZE10]|uniref:Aminoglycoside phosphotransferase domain-containing protein n=1 Tax=Dothistroma septosporum (strain NZE10 / CBS 128990) TaxID=675120 RepID=N1PVD4_DOTSN|nr:hypothetical protein DOTSEDRAFT_126816 [Dothistroma septosporum NZE10]